MRKRSCNVANCRVRDSIQECASPPEFIFKIPFKNDGNICCRLTVGILVMIAVLGGILLVVVIAEVVRYLRKRGGAKENEKGKTGKEEVKKKEAPMAKE